MRLLKGKRLWKKWVYDTTLARELNTYCLILLGDLARNTGDEAAGSEAEALNMRFVHSPGNDEAFSFYKSLETFEGDGSGIHGEWAFEHFCIGDAGAVLEFGAGGSGAESGNGYADRRDFFGEGFAEGKHEGFAGVVDGHVGARLERGG